MGQNCLGGLPGGQALLGLITAPGHDGQGAPDAAVDGVDVDAQQIIRPHILRQGHPLAQTHGSIRLPGQVNLHIFVVFLQIIPAIPGDLQIQGGFPDLHPIIFLHRAAVQSAVARIQDDDHVLLLCSHRHRQHQNQRQSQRQQPNPPSVSHGTPSKSFGMQSYFIIAVKQKAAACAAAFTGRSAFSLPRVRLPPGSCREYPGSPHCPPR